MVNGQPGKYSTDTDSVIALKQVGMIGSKDLAVPSFVRLRF
jgi:hypothetical protein